MSIDPANMPLPQGGGPAMDDFGMPVQPPSKALSYLLLAGALICAVGAAGLCLAGVLKRNHALVGISMGLCAVGVIAGLEAGPDPNRTGRIRQANAALGSVGQRIENITRAACVLIFVGGLSTFDTSDG